MILKVVSAAVRGPYLLDVAFNDGTTKRVNVRPLLNGPVFLPLRDPEFFERVSLDPVAGVVEWPNGADLAPEALYELPDLSAESASGNAASA